MRQSRVASLAEHAEIDTLFTALEETRPKSNRTVFSSIVSKSMLRCSSHSVRLISLGCSGLVLLCLRIAPTYSNCSHRRRLSWFPSVTSTEDATTGELEYLKVALIHSIQPQWKESG
ncbi:uncharacterized protein BDR25DRAFT_348960 [Lindgomyces ingoldianus]|uniref:Uncharacterized protein n=1 Tax=Lindgomyces ingoldianus TaxID=673940 RepID=A0ACB6REC4_9PLEO|nr:uncharacterized protein BDR25DRAFT_348960 [Lindgomyces ingoldianus]KAF2477070.1 hypothetical protein BDR25DRAFT_348960 [Lindgomyces ingoldianus]